MAAEAYQGTDWLSLTEFLRIVGKRVLQLTWKSGEVHNISFTNRQGLIRATYYIRLAGQEKSAFISDAMLVAPTEDGRFVQIALPASAGGRSMYPFVALVPLSRRMLTRGAGIARANTRRGNASTWEDMVAMETRLAIVEPEPPEGQDAPRKETAPLSR
jgi:hypothetical protein